ncbi:Uncharacterized protein OBRU01_17718, partial [Operophtera brumata]
MASLWMRSMISRQRLSAAGGPIVAEAVPRAFRGRTAGRPGGAALLAFPTVQLRLLCEVPLQLAVLLCVFQHEVLAHTAVPRRVPSLEVDQVCVYMYHTPSIVHLEHYNKQATMAFKFVVFFGLVAAASAGLLPAAPVAYHSAPFVVFFGLVAAASAGLLPAAPFVVFFGLVAAASAGLLPAAP